MKKSKIDICPLGDAIKQQKGSIKIQDDVEYKLCRVRLWAKGVVLRKKSYGREIKTKKQQVCKAGQFIVAEIDAKMGGFGIIPAELDGAIVSSHYYLYDFDETKLHPNYLNHFIRTPTFQKQVVAKGSTNYARIPPGDVLKYFIPLPDIPRQLEIINFVEKLRKRLDKLIQLNEDTTAEIN